MFKRNTTVVAHGQALRRSGQRAEFVKNAIRERVVAVAGNGEEAVRLAGDNRPDVVLMDVTMPKMDAIDATRRIKDALPAVMVIGLTVQPAEHVDTAMKQAGAVALVKKDAAVEDLYQTIQAARKEPLNAE
ncbi:MAG: response regulator transcription factor [Nitrospira sp.]|nr:response regulator transcription factor [Nitrospira sp.]